MLFPRKLLPGCRWLYPCLAAAVLFGALLVQHLRVAHLGAALVRATQEQIMADPALLGFAARRGPALYQEHCASCHGKQLQGEPAKGAPRLNDAVWLYGTGSVADIENTILYGIRSGNPRAHNLTEMPAFGRSGRLSVQNVDDVVEYVRALSQQPHDNAAAKRGMVLFYSAGNCFDCHGSDGYGVSDYGTPPLNGRGDTWVYGGDRASLHQSIYDGRHGLCPAWIGTLSFVQIRVLAVYLHQASNHD